jgi:uncharacterized membrane protein
MDTFERGKVVVQLARLLFVTASFIVLLPLALYFFLWVGAIGIPHRLNPALDIYASIWSLAAIAAAVFNIRVVSAVDKGRDPEALWLVCAISVLSVVSCPEWFY